MAIKKNRPPPSRPRWTAEEINVLRTLYNTMPAWELQAKYLPNRSMKAIAMKALKSGITDSAANEQWTEREIEMLQAHMDMPVKELQARFLPGRTFWSITNKKSLLKNKKDKTVRYASGREKRRRTGPKWTQEELDLLDRHYGTMPADQLQATYFPNRTVRSVTQKAYMRTGIETHAGQWTKEELAALRENYGKTPVAKMPGTILPGRSRRSIENKITQLGIRITRDGNEDTNDR